MNVFGKEAGGIEKSLPGSSPPDNWVALGGEYQEIEMSFIR
jgi:hypothetical protein